MVGVGGLGSGGCPGLDQLIVGLESGEWQRIGVGIRGVLVVVGGWLWWAFVLGLRGWLGVGW